MEQIDREKAQRVWCRVQAQQQASPEPNPEGLLLEELTDARLLQQLARGGDRAVGRLAEQTLRRAAILRGICRLCDLTPPTLLPRPDLRQNALWRHLTGRFLRRLREYRRLSEQEELGPLYDCLAQQLQGALADLAEIIGK